MQHNDLRTAALHGYTGRRVYHLNYHGLPGDKTGELIVEVRYSAPGSRQFTTISESGSKLIINKVLKRLVTSEEEAQNSANRQQTALTSQNYSFELVREEANGPNHYYVMKVEPRITNNKANNKFLYRGTVWVDANDFAVARIEAVPAQNPSFWISHTEIEQRYEKFGKFWLPVRNRSVSKVRLGGKATLQIDYKDYHIATDAASLTQDLKHGNGPQP